MRSSNGIWDWKKRRLTVCSESRFCTKSESSTSGDRRMNTVWTLCSRTRNYGESGSSKSTRNGTCRKLWHKRETVRNLWILHKIYGNRILSGETRVEDLNKMWDLSGNSGSGDFWKILGMEILENLGVAALEAQRENIWEFWALWIIKLVEIREF